MRDKALGVLKKWLKLEAPKMTYEDHLKLWKGLFYCMWMADKPKYQKELAERLTGIIGVLYKASSDVGQVSWILYVKAFWQTMCREWRGIDRLRLNKYYQLMKLMMVEGFKLLRDHCANKELTKAYFEILQEFPMNVTNDKVPAGVKIFFLENYSEVLEAVEFSLESEAEISALCEPLIHLLHVCKDKVLVKAIEGAVRAVSELNEGAAKLFLSAQLSTLAGQADLKESNRKVAYSLQEHMKQ